MIGTLFEFKGEIVEVRIDNTNCLFRTQQFGGGFAPIEGIRIDKKGALKEHPDLEGDSQWREKTIKRFKEKLKNLETERARINYIIEDLSKFGYKPLYEQRKGHRVKKLY